MSHSGGGGDAPSFSDKDEEIQYWKTLAEQYLKDCERIQKESDEFIAESQQLEKEYEATIDQSEQKIKELTLAKNRLQNEVDSLQAKVDQLNKENNNYQTEIATMKADKVQMQKYIRDLEQKNDDLERTRRNIEETIANVEAAFNTEIERNAMLENEMDEKESLKEKLQRLADETRDLKQELLVKERERVPDNERLSNGFKMPMVDSNRLKEIETQTTPVKSGDFAPPLSPASRVVALNIVSDLIRRIGGLERRLERSRMEYRDVSINNNDIRSTRNTATPTNNSKLKNPAINNNIQGLK